jgi:hypothetical protein
MKCLIEESKGAAESHTWYLDLYVIDVLRQETVATFWIVVK